MFQEIHLVISEIRNLNKIMNTKRNLLQNNALNNELVIRSL